MYLVEAKARIDNPDAIREVLLAGGAVLEDKNRHTDIYFRTPMGRFKLREGERGSCLMYREHPRKDMQALVRYDIEPIAGAARVGAMLAMVGRRKVMLKNREVYAFDRATVHLDNIHGLGSFLEIEVRVSDPAKAGEYALLCRDCMRRLGLDPASFETAGYDELLTRAA
ncbi:class IV adenylate cyclase [Desulfovibrio ferrophilus]|uniref:Putative Adenylate cyclase n=1 Tax=Desulfovibrio ferrophilus TaxID=241368 RepID=A0A2Z6B1B1_9BACT|nr:CYTH domain-containing protein [Desulfovibrio ferrophilus]BBD09220.1 putative Adenylate cyclase [Desulfovibrio ferrophilus]